MTGLFIYSAVSKAIYLTQRRKDATNTNLYQTLRRSAVA